MESKNAKHPFPWIQMSEMDVPGQIFFYVAIQECIRLWLLMGEVTL